MSLLLSDKKGICVLPVTRTDLTANYSPQSQGGAVPNDIWMKILSIILESNRGTTNSMSSPFNFSISLACKTFHQMIVNIFNFHSRLPFVFSSPKAISSKEEKLNQISNDLTYINCDHEGNRYFRSPNGSQNCVLNILKICGSFYSLDLSRVIFSNGPIDKKSLHIVSCTRHQDRLIIISYNVVSIFNLDHQGKFILDDEANPLVASYFETPLEEMMHCNVGFYENRLFWSKLGTGDFFMCDLAEELKWGSIKNPLPELMWPGFININGFLYISYKENETLESTIETNSYYIPVDFDSANNSLRELTSPTSFKTTSCKPHYTPEGYVQALNGGLDSGRKYQAAVDANGGYSKAPPKNVASWLYYPTNENWMIDHSEPNLQVIDLKNNTMWISTEANIRSPDILKQETIFLDEDLLLVSYSNNSFRAIYLPTRNEVTRELQRVLKSALKPGYSLLTFSFKKSGKETTVTLLQIQSPKNPPPPGVDNDDKPEKQVVITTTFTLKDQDLAQMVETPSDNASSLDSSLNAELSSLESDVSKLDLEGLGLKTLVGVGKVSLPKVTSFFSVRHEEHLELIEPVEEPKSLIDLKSAEESKVRTDPRAPAIVPDNLQNKDSTEQSQCKRITMVALLALVSIAVVSMTLIGIFATMGAHASWAPQFMKSLSQALMPAYLPYIFISTTPAYLVILAIGATIQAKRS